MFLFGLIAVLLFLTFFNLYPFWMQELIWQGFCWYMMVVIGILVFRFLLWGIGVHFGFVIWLFPKFRKAYCKTYKSILPLFSFETKSDLFNPLSVLFRAISLSAIVFVGYKFCQDEKNLEDLKEFTTKGVSDLLDYSKEWDFGKL